jgi:hypothetical protein
MVLFLATGGRMIFNRKSKDGKVKAEVYINYGDGNGSANGQKRIKKAKVLINPCLSVLEILKMVSNIEYTPDESATGHMGSMITAIDGFKIDLTHFWLYYLREEDDAGWKLPMETPDSVLIKKNTMIAWRYHDLQKRGPGAAGNQIFGPFFSTECISRVKRCNRQF